MNPIMNPENPFTLLSLIAAPAVLTNACSVLVMSTSNRLARTLDRSRVLTRQLEIEEDGKAESSKADDGILESSEVMSLRELQAAEQRAVLLMRAMRFFYLALSGFASSVFLSIFGAVIVSHSPSVVARTMEAIALVVGIGAVSSVVSGAFLLVRETRIAVAVLHEQSVYIQAKVENRLKQQRHEHA